MMSSSAVLQHTVKNCVPKILNVPVLIRELWFRYLDFVSERVKCGRAYHQIIIIVLCVPTRINPF